MQTNKYHTLIPNTNTNKSLLCKALSTNYIICLSTNQTINSQTPFEHYQVIRTYPDIQNAKATAASITHYLLLPLIHPI